MKICGIICEFNPFHNGHKYLLEQAKLLTGCDYTVCIMSGNFTQRGEAAVMDKYTRAKQAVLGGADCVIELPAAFSVSPAEIFAQGAVKILSSIPDLKVIAFGCENADKDELTRNAKICSEENERFKNVLYGSLKRGESYIKSFYSAVESSGGNSEILQKPNNILAVEYIKAILKLRPALDICPIKRIGADYNETLIKENFSSASAIRKNHNDPRIAQNVPEYVYNDLKFTKNRAEDFEKAFKLILSRTSADELKRVYGCSEGLENALKSLENEPYAKIIESATSKRYTSSRIKRILCSAFLGIYRADCEKFLSSPLYVTPLAVKKTCADSILPLLAKSPAPLITSGSGAQKLEEPANKCKRLDDFATAQYCQIAGISNTNKLLTV